MALGQEGQLSQSVQQALLRQAAEQRVPEAGVVPDHGGPSGVVPGGGTGGQGALGTASWAGLQSPTLAFGGSLGQGGQPFGAGSAVLQGVGANGSGSGPFLGFPGLTQQSLAALGGGSSGLQQGIMQYTPEGSELADAQALAVAMAAKGANGSSKPGGAKLPARRAFMSLEVDETKSLGQTPPPRLRWTPQLHRRFKEAVEHLGGATNATPKAIVAAMQVKDLTVYHVKSHLQKYRTSEAEMRKGPKKGGRGRGSLAARDPAATADGPSTSRGVGGAEKPDSADRGSDLVKVLEEIENLKGQLKAQIQKTEEAHAASASHSRALERIQRELIERGWDLPSPSGGAGSAEVSPGKARAPQLGSPKVPWGPTSAAPEGPASGPSLGPRPAAPEGPAE